MHARAEPSTAAGAARWGTGRACAAREKQPPKSPPLDKKPPPTRSFESARTRERIGATIGRAKADGGKDTAHLVLPMRGRGGGDGAGARAGAWEERRESSVADAATTTLLLQV